MNYRFILLLMRKITKSTYNFQEFDYLSIVVFKYIIINKIILKKINNL